LPGVPSPRLGFNGGYVEVGWVMTGEPIPYYVARAAWAGPKVDHPFSLADGGIGAWELAARYSTVDLNDISWLRARLTLKGSEPQDLPGICSITSCSHSLIGDLTTAGPFGIKTEKIKKRCHSNHIYQ
jgi:Phosphate-selective porin O and P